MYFRIIENLNYIDLDLIEFNNILHNLLCIVLFFTNNTFENICKYFQGQHRWLYGL